MIIFPPPKLPACAMGAWQRTGILASISFQCASFLSAEGIFFPHAEKVQTCDPSPRFWNSRVQGTLYYVVTWKIYLPNLHDVFEISLLLLYLCGLKKKNKILEKERGLLVFLSGDKVMVCYIHRRKTLAQWWSLCFVCAKSQVWSPPPPFGISR